MIQFFTYFILGFCITWLNLFMWGLSNGPVNAVPYFALLGSLLLLIVAASLALFLSRIAAVVALVATLFVLPWPIMILLAENSWIGFIFLSVPPVTAGAMAVRQIWIPRSEKWLAMRSSPRLSVRVPLAFLPLVLFVLTFNARLVVALLLEGLPK